MRFSRHGFGFSLEIGAAARYILFWLANLLPARLARDPASDFLQHLICKTRNRFSDSVFAGILKKVFLDSARLGHTYVYVYIYMYLHICNTQPAGISGSRFVYLLNQQQALGVPWLPYTYMHKTCVFCIYISSIVPLQYSFIARHLILWTRWSMGRGGRWVLEPGRVV